MSSKLTKPGTLLWGDVLKHRAPYSAKSATNKPTESLPRDM